MSGLRLVDGVGNGYSAKVDSGNRLHTYSVSISEEHDANFKGYAYTIAFDGLKPVQVKKIEKIG